MASQTEENQIQIEMMANSFLYINKQPLVKKPSDYGMEYEDLSFKTDDGLNLAAWLIKGTKNKTIIFSHPLAFTKYGYSLNHEGSVKSGYSKDVEFLPSVKHLVDAGYSVFMYDQRNHGESESEQNAIHDPYKANLDNAAAIEFVSNIPSLKGDVIGLISHCQSAYKEMVSMSKNPKLYNSANVKALAITQPLAIRKFYEKLGLSNEIIDSLKDVYKEKGVDLEKQNPLLFADKTIVPTLMLQNINDPWGEVEHSKQIFEKIPTEKEMIWIDEEAHRFVAYNWFNDNPEKLLSFFNKNL
ncbi:hypothetical protein FLM55_08220 [Francisella sp. Scap27]|uniref:alpha/beta hydrolase family protein n=1 Tax=Francisella sp. Scap27 TaxID=2589986 RepID=UPI0015BAD093|nr:hypothetical protein [Francisella sp. Scap27]QLE79720.1 hypothetical protein FLM55_08220 [Francisella sp. Scap27]